MSRTIEISDKAYSILSKRAKNVGVTPDVYVDESLVKGDFVKSTRENGKKTKTSEKDKLKAWEDFIGAAARIPKPKKKIMPSRFGKILVEKYRKQGLNLENFE